MRLEETGIPGCHLVHAANAGDARGRFVKTYKADDFAAFGLEDDWREEIHTTSRAGVVRGMHFQTPPADNAKLLFCVAGEVLDVVVDLRCGSPTYGQHRAFTLSADNARGLYVPRGLAHGFAAMVEGTTMFYKITGDFSPGHDAGIAWDGFGFAWPFSDPIMSDRDRALLPLSAFESPFTYLGEERIG